MIRFLRSLFGRPTPPRECEWLETFDGWYVDGWPGSAEAILRAAHHRFPGAEVIVAERLSDRVHRVHTIPWPPHSAGRFMVCD